MLAGSVGVIAAGGYPAAEGERSLRAPLPPCTIVPPGVDVERFRPQTTAQKIATRARLGLPTDGPLVTSVSRLVPRKGMDTLVRASVELRVDHPDLTVAIAGKGRDTGRLQKLIDQLDAPVTLLGRIGDNDLVDLYAAGDVFSMLCRTDGAASNRRASASSSSKRRHQVFPRSPGAAVAPTRLSSTTRRGSWSTTLMIQPLPPRRSGAARRPRPSPRWPTQVAAAPRPSSATTSSPSDSARDRCDGDPMTFPEPGTRFFQLSWAGTIAFVITAGAATSPSTFELAAVAVSLTLFFAGIVTMLWAFFIAVNRSRVDAIGVGGLYFEPAAPPRWCAGTSSAPRRCNLSGIVTASIRPFTPLAFGTLVWIFGIGMMGLWTARYGEFEPPTGRTATAPNPTPTPDEGDGADERSCYRFGNPIEGTDMVDQTTERTIIAATPDACYAARSTSSATPNGPAT